ncbi:MAG TPA: hypothetical protein VNA88_14780 [Candidatus Kapabacteria bacterium]|nr:hypothetical protein [Candidatus Kapabacteria bacterium]
MSRYALPFAALLFALTAARCGPGTMFEATPSIRGELRAIIPASGASDLGFARIEGSRNDDLPYDKADVTVTRATTISRRRGGALEPITFDSLRVGMLVEATFTGPVAESYPVRATAASIIVIEP